MVSGSISRRTTNTISVSMIGVFLLLYSWLAWRQPDGSWDAWAIWNLRAKFYAAGAWSSVSALNYSHPDYPPLLPLLVAAGWQITGVSALWPMLLHGLVLGGALWLLRDRWQAVALVGGAAALYAPMQNADLPLALCLLAACVAYEGRSECGVGAALGVGLLVKNEGALMAMAFGVAWVVMERRLPYRALLAALPGLVLLMVYKALVPVSNDIMGAGGALDRALDWSRYGVIAGYATWGLVTFAGGALVVLVLGLWVMRVRVRWSVSLVAIAMIWLGYLAVYVITPNDLTWHLSTSYDRLVLHLFPALVYTLTRPSESAI